jgi:hypothetical protein
MKVKILVADDHTYLETIINDFIENKKVIDIKYILEPYVPKLQPDNLLIAIVHYEEKE